MASAKISVGRGGVEEEGGDGGLEIWRWAWSVLQVERKEKKVDVAA